MNSDRIRDLTRSLQSGKEYVKATKRKVWDNYLREHIINITIEEKDKEELIRWAESTKIQPETVHQITDSYDWRSPADPIYI